MDAATYPRLIPISAMAHIAGVTVQWLRNEADACRIPCLRAGNRILVDRETVERILLERAAKLPEAAP